nr:hypothetical protein [Chloroflexia bacterium]
AGTAGSGVLLEVPLAPAAGVARLLIARTVWEPDADTGPVTHPGELGILVEDGTLTVAAASGIEAQLSPERRGVVFPAGAPHRIRNAEAGEATALLAGVVATDQPLALAVTPSPVPTATPTPTPVPPPAIGTVVYEASVENGGFEDWTLEGGWLLYEGLLVNDGEGGSITVPYSTDNMANHAVEIELRVVEGGESEDDGFNLWIRGGELDFYADLNFSEFWSGDRGIDVLTYVAGDEELDGFYELDFGEWNTYRLEIDGNFAEVSVNGELYFADDDNRLLRGSGDSIGIAADNTLQVEIAQVRVIAGDNSGPASVDAQDQAVAPDRNADSVPADLLASLPTAGDLPDEWQVTDEEVRRNVRRVAETYSNPQEAEARFTELGWQDNAYRGYEAAPGELPSVYISLHRFDSAASAGAAVDFVAGDFVAEGEEDAGALDVGNRARLTLVEADGSYVSTVVTHVGPVLALVAYYSAAGDYPTAEAEAVAEVVVGRLGGDAVAVVPPVNPGVPDVPLAALTALLPTAGQVPAGFLSVEDGGRSAAEIVATFPDPADAERRFAEWGWQDNAFRTFETADGSASVQVSAHRFADVAGAEAALPYFADGRNAILGLGDIAVEPVGEQSRAIGGVGDQGNEVTLYVRRGATLFRITALSAAGDPTAATIAAARATGGRAVSAAWSGAAGEDRTLNASGGTSVELRQLASVAG